MVLNLQEHASCSTPSLHLKHTQAGHQWAACRACAHSAAPHLQPRQLRPVLVSKAHLGLKCNKHGMPAGHTEPLLRSHDGRLGHDMQHIVPIATGVQHLHTCKWARCMGGMDACWWSRFTCTNRQECHNAGGVGAGMDARWWSRFTCTNRQECRSPGRAGAVTQQLESEPAPAERPRTLLR